MDKITFDERLLTSLRKRLPEGLYPYYRYGTGSDKKILSIRLEDTGKNVLDVGMGFVKALNQAFPLYVDLMVKGLEAETYCKECERICGYKSQKHWSTKDE